MTEFAADAWARALASARTAEQIAESDPDSAASRSYYAAFHAVSALFALREISFTKHAHVRATVHRDLIHTGEWIEHLGFQFDFLWNLRQTGDYGGKYHVSKEDAKAAVKAAHAILDAVRTSSAGKFE